MPGAVAPPPLEAPAPEPVEMVAVADWPLAAEAMPRAATSVAAIEAVVARTAAARRESLELGANRPLFLRPTELAVGLALKELRYGLRPRPTRPWGCNNPFGSSAPGHSGPGFGVLRGAVYPRPRRLHDPCGIIRGPRRPVRPGGFSTMKTYVATPADRQRDWYVVDAEGQTLGRLATRIADALRGKRKPEYTPHVDTGDFVIVVNAEKIRVTGDKLAQKTYYRHTGYPGGIRSRTLGEMLDRRPEEVIRKAVKGMLPRNRLARAQLRKLKVYAGPEHPHQAQQPKPMETDS
jgi:large subunit ribosomal protein L13